MKDYYRLLSKHLPIDCKISDNEYCGKCCFKTEMLLTRLDISRIKSLGYREDYFVNRGGEIPKLKNVNGKCVFLDEETKACKIYPYRPLGCRLYPLIYNVKEDKVEVDSLCPKRNSISKSKVKKYERFVRELVVILMSEWGSKA